MVLDERCFVFDEVFIGMCLLGCVYWDVLLRGVY